MEALRALGQQLLAIWQQLGVGQKVTVTLSGLVLVIALGTVVFYTSRGDYALLFGRLGSEEAGKVISALDEQSIDYKVGEGGGAIYVPRSVVYKTRMTLASQGVPKSGGVGYELFDKPTFGQSDMAQRINRLRALQGEMARSINEMEGVESSRVMVVMQENRLIVDPSKKPTASVFLKLSTAGILDQQGVNAVRFLVANAVPGLKYHNVAVVDNFNNTLAGNEDDGSFTAVSGTRLAAQRNTEKYLTGKVKKLLDATLGPGQAWVAVNADLDHDSIITEDLKLQPTGKVERSSTIKSEKTETSGARAGGVPGTALNINTSTNAAGPGIAGNILENNETTTQWANGHTRTNRTIMPGAIRRITASVLVNQRVVDGQPVARQAPELTMLTNIVSQALGLKTDASGVGDQIVVSELAFNTTASDAMNEKFESDQSRTFMWDLARTGLYVLLGIAALFAFWKLVQRSAEEVIPTGIPVGQLVMGAAPAMAGAAPMVAAPAGMAAPAGTAAPGASAADTASQIDAAGMDIEQIEEQLKDPSKLSVAEIQALRAKREEEKERIRLLKEMAAEDEEEEEEDVEVIQQEKQKLIMDFGLGKRRPERVNIEVLREMITDSPEQMSVAARRWLTQAQEETQGDKSGDMGSASDSTNG